MVVLIDMQHIKITILCPTHRGLRRDAINASQDVLQIWEAQLSKALPMAWFQIASQRRPRRAKHTQF